MKKESFKCVFNNEEKEFDILYTFKSLKTNKDYIIYTDNTYENNNLNIYASIYYPFDEEKELENIESNEDWEEVENFLSSINGESNE